MVNRSLLIEEVASRFGAEEGLALDLALRALGCSDGATLPLDGINWVRVLELGLRNGVLPALAFSLTRGQRRREDGSPAVQFQWVFDAILADNRRRNAILQAEMDIVAEALNDAGVTFRFRKGLALARRYYIDAAARRTGDIDILVDRQEMARFTTAMRCCGYVQGRVSVTGNEIQEFDRRTQAYWRLHLRNVSLPFVKLTGDDVVVVDPCHSLLPATERSELSTALFARRDGHGSDFLTEVDNVIDVAVQFDVEASTSYYAEQGRSITLKKCAELAVALSTLEDSGRSELWARALYLGCLPRVRRAAAAVEPLLEEPRCLEPAPPVEGKSITRRALLTELFGRTHQQASLSPVPGPRAGM